MAKLPEGVEYSEVKHMYRATLDNRSSMWFETAKEAAEVYKMAVKYQQFFQLNFPEYLR